MKVYSLCEKAQADLHQAKEVAKFGFWSLAGNRLYYAAFHMAAYSAPYPFTFRDIFKSL